MISDESLELIAKSFKNFKLLVLSSCEGFSTDGLASIAANCRIQKDKEKKGSCKILARKYMQIRGHAYQLNPNAPKERVYKRVL